MTVSNVFSILHSLADSADVRSGTPGHCMRVATYVSYLLKALHTDDDESQQIQAAARVHDIGKLGLPIEVLTAPRKLSIDEWKTIRSHSQRGADALAVRPEARRMAHLVLHHHERIDGHGYPGRLRGTAIPFGSRVIAVADSFEAMTHDRPYRAGLHIGTAIQQLWQDSDQQWDRQIVAAFVEEALPALLWDGRLAIAQAQLVRQSDVETKVG